MRSFAVLAAVAGLALAHGGEHGGDHGDWSPKGTGAPVYVTDVVTAYTTYCPSSTQITHNGVTYTVTEATTLTISNCPCTVTRPVSSATPSTAAPKPSTPAASTGAPVKPSSYFPSVSAPSSAAPVTSAPAQYTGAANKAQVAGAGLLAVLGAAAAAL